MTKQWLRQRQRDYYHRLAKMEGYRSRASYKLLQVANKYPLMKKGDVVVDLGSAPGGWMQVALNIVGEKGFVLGIDVMPIKDLNKENAATMLADVEKLSPEDILERLPHKPDVILSDISPNISGVWGLDHARQLDLAKTVVELARELLSPEGNLFVKIFQGEYFRDFITNVKQFYEYVRIVKPKASRKKSAEMYILALSLKA